MTVINRDPEDLLAWPATEVTTQVDRELEESEDRRTGDEDIGPGDADVVLDEDIVSEIDAAARMVVARRVFPLDAVMPWPSRRPGMVSPAVAGWCGGVSGSGLRHPNATT